MLVTTTPSIEGRKIKEYKGLVVGEVILGANIFKDVFAAFSDILGGRSQAYESSLKEARDSAILEMKEKAKQMGANAILGVDVDYETVGSKGSMLMVNVSGTAVVLED